MNYAEDRLDRRARHDDNSSSGLVADWQRGLELLESSDDCNEDGHELLGRTLRDVGSCRHAAFHYGMAWMVSPTSSRAAGDYAQMSELAGFPEVGVLALLHYRAGGKLRQAPEKSETGGSKNEGQRNNLLSSLGSNGHCGCGFSECGQSMCFVPMMGLEPIVNALARYTRQCRKDLYQQQMPTAYEVLSSVAKKNMKPVLLVSESDDELLKFWINNEESSTFRPLEPVVQLLLVKLLYVTLPCLAAEAVVQLRFEHPRALANTFKSHWAYFVLIRAVVLGERIKPHRRRTDTFYHVPVWDLLWNKDQRKQVVTQSYGHDARVDGDGTRSVWTRLEETLEYLRQNRHEEAAEIPRTWWCQHHSCYKPLFIVGDSHVLSLAWQTILVPAPRVAVPVVTTGLKTWHTRSDTRFFTQYLLQTCLDRLPLSCCRTIVVSAGEIDCREGIGGELLQGYGDKCHDQVQETVSGYVQSLAHISCERHIQILVLPVAPHAHRSDKNGKSMGRAFRRQTMQRWNQQLKTELLSCRGVYLLNYEDSLRQAGSSDYVLDPVFNADYTHMNSAFVPHLERALQESGCDLSLL